MPTRNIVAVADSTELNKVIPVPLPGVAGFAFKRDDNTIQIMDPDGVAGTFLNIPAFAVAGVAAGYKIARGEHTQVAASDTVVTGLTTVVAVIVTPRAPTVKQLWFGASIGDQAGTPAAGSILITSYKPTNNTNDSTPTAATDFTDNIKVSWIAVGT